MRGWLHTLSYFCWQIFLLVVILVILVQVGTAMWEAVS